MATLWGKSLVICIVLLVSGCASGTPLDIIIPTPKPSPVYTEYMGNLNYTNNANHLYHSLVDTKREKAMLVPRKMELQGLELAAKGEMDIIESAGDRLSNGLYGTLVALAGILGWQLPRPGEKAKVLEALHKEPPHLNH